MIQYALKTLILILCLLTGSVCIAAAIPQTDNTQTEAVGGQLKINKWTLFNSTDEQIRIDTAVELLKDTSKEARSVLLEALSITSKNTTPRTSVCKAITQFRSWSKQIPNNDDFIKPLMEIIKTSKNSHAKIAAQASLIFSYAKIEKHLKAIINSDTLETQAKLNAIYTLQIRPDKEAVSVLIDLLDSSDAKISAAAGNALQEWLPLGNDKQMWLKVLKDLERKSRSDILRERLLAQQDKVRQLSEEALAWQTSYMQAIDKIYQQTTDETQRTALIAENLSSDRSSLRIWAVDKIDTWRKSGKPLPLETITEPLLTLISDPISDIRESTARLLGLLTNVNSTEKLLAQLKVEPKQSVKELQLIALGHVCNYALSPGSEIAIDPNIRKETLIQAADYLKNQDSVVGTETVRNLLLKNGMDANSVEPYFEMIKDAYNKPQNTNNTKSALLNEMAILCSPDSAYRNIAINLFSDTFKTEIDNNEPLISEPAVIGLFKTDQAKAFTILKEKGFSKHPSQKVRYQLMETAATIGTAKDLEWLGEVLTSDATNDEKHQATSAMMKIFQHCNSDILFEWAKRISKTTDTKKQTLISTKVQTLLELAETKAMAQNNTTLLKPIRQSLAEKYKQTSAYPAAAKYYGILLQDSNDPNERAALTNNILEIHLLSGQIDSATQLIANILLAKDIEPASLTAQTLNNYFSENKKLDQRKQLLTKITSIEIQQGLLRPQWQQIIAELKTLLH